MTNYLQMSRLVHPVGILFQRGLTFFSIKEESLVYLKSKNKPEAIRKTHTYTQNNISETSKRIAGKQVNSDGDIVSGSPVLILCLYFL